MLLAVLASFTPAALPVLPPAKQRRVEGCAAIHNIAQNRCHAYVVSFSSPAPSHACSLCSLVFYTASPGLLPRHLPGVESGSHEL